MRLGRILEVVDSNVEGKAPLNDRHVSVFRIQDKRIAEVGHHAGDLYAQDEFFS